MHVRALLATTSSMVAELPEDPGAPLRAWVALGSPCTSVFVPVFPPEHVPAALAEPATWHRFATLRDRVEAEPGALTGVRAVLGPVETDLWEEADAAAADASDREAFAARAWDAVDTALRRLGV
ncbi:MAG: hypothetical protein M5U14_04520 [Acidimicrobiia bacterium]|nr:hypothetical protein [Acidimicrobiia bacterium]